MKIAFFSSKPYDETAFREIADGRHELLFFEERLTAKTAFLAAGSGAACIFVNDAATAESIRALAAGGTRILALRSAGYNHVDLAAAKECGMTVARVPAYSPHAVAEHAVALMLALNRRIHRAYNRVREGNFALDGLMGFDLHGKTAGIVGTGQIGAIVARILRGFGCHVLCFDLAPHPDCVAAGARYCDLPTLFSESDIVTLHCPLNAKTRYLIGEETLSGMKDGVMIINTSRGGLIDTRAAIRALKTGRIGFLGLDVYEEESELFFDDLSDSVIQDDVFMRLLTFPNVIVTGHQAFFTREAIHNIAATTMANIAAFVAGEKSGNEV